MWHDQCCLSCDDSCRLVCEVCSSCTTVELPYGQLVKYACTGSIQRQAMLLRINVVSGFKLAEYSTPSRCHTFYNPWVDTFVWGKWNNALIPLMSGCHIHYAWWSDDHASIGLWQEIFSTFGKDFQLFTATVIIVVRWANITSNFWHLKHPDFTVVKGRTLILPVNSHSP